MRCAAMRHTFFIIVYFHVISCILNYVLLILYIYPAYFYTICLQVFSFKVI